MRTANQSAGLELVQRGRLAATELLAHLYRTGARLKLIDLDEALYKAVSYGETWRIKLLLEAGADVHASDDAPLRVAAMFGETEAVRLLLEAGADIHAKSDQALRMADIYGKTETVRLLEAWLEERGDFPQPDGDGGSGP